MLNYYNKHNLLKNRILMKNRPDLPILSALISLLFFMLSCSSDSGTGPSDSDKQILRGTVTLTGEWPETPSDVRMVASLTFPPDSPNDFILGESIPENAGSYAYTFELDSGQYHLVGVVWRTTNEDWNISNICGAYTEDNSFVPEAVILKPGKTVQNIDFSIDRSKAGISSESEISGRIEFEGQWPRQYTHAIAVASVKNPFSASLSFSDLSFGNIIGNGAQSANYSIEAAPATYQAVGLLFYNTNAPMSDDPFFYSQSFNALTIADVTVAENQTVTGPDFDIAFTVPESGIKGKVVFTGNWPTEPAEVRLIATKVFPPSLDDLIMGESLPTDEESVSYFFHLPPDTYQVVGVVWRAAGQELALTSICGAYFSGDDSLATAEVVINSDDHIVENIHMTVNRSKARQVTDTYITGSIRFLGEWPSDIVEARVIATTKFNIFPQELPTMLDLGFSNGVEPGNDEADYRIQAFPGTFVATGVLFFKQGQKLSMDDIFYSLDVNGLDLTPYTVEINTTVGGPEFEIEF